MRRLLKFLLVLAAIGVGAGWWLTSPEFIRASDLPDHSGDPARGETIFAEGGCASCHAAPGASGDDKRVLAGGLAFPSDFGTFYAPNISPGPQGIGDWSTADLVTAMQKGVRPDGAHYYPAFPYTSYARMDMRDIIDLKAYLDTLPVSEVVSKPHDVGFPFSIRRGLGLWKLLYLDPDPVIDVAETEQLLRGRDLVEGAGHCSECHTPRNLIGGLNTSRWLAGGPNPDGEGTIPNITPHETGIGSWSETDIVYYLESGFTPDFDSAGGAMAKVIDNTAKLDPTDREAIAAYLKAVPAVAD
ncbi:c-type cytochrome [Halovulum sp. GXIMD14793]